MKNNKAFTLIELLAVITILVILALIITPIVDTKIKSSKDKIYRVQIENIRMAGETYYSDNRLLMPSNDSYTSITLSELISQGYINSNIKNPKTGEILDNQITVQVHNNASGIAYYVCPIDNECI